MQQCELKFYFWESSPSTQTKLPLGLGKLPVDTEKVTECLVKVAVDPENPPSTMKQQSLWVWKKSRRVVLISVFAQFLIFTILVTASQGYST